MNTKTTTSSALLDAMNAAIDALTDERADETFKADAVDLLRVEVGKLTAPPVPGTRVNSGGSAFPLAIETSDGVDTLVHTNLGMTKREYFAAHAPDVPADFPWAEGETDLEQLLVRWRLHYADAMLKALES